MKCEYGCKQESKYITTNGRQCCSKHQNSCPAVRAKNSEGLQKAHADGRCSTKQLDGKREWSKGKTARTDPRIKSRYDPNEVFSENSPICNEAVRKHIFVEKLLDYQCKECGLGPEWRGKPITLELDHISGNNKDNRLENLRFLCPNCHAQTPTYKGKNNTGLIKVSDAKLIMALNKAPNIRQALVEVGLSPKGGNYDRAKRLLLQKQE